MQTETIADAVTAALDVARRAQRLSIALRHHERHVDHAHAAELRKLGVVLGDTASTIMATLATATPAVRDTILLK